VMTAASAIVTLHEHPRIAVQAAGVSRW
jgi:hypothetical protein